ncbi:hypothetical protein Tco_0118811 [Tanacetum coccineum]
MMYRRRPVVVLRSGYVLAILYSLLCITGALIAQGMADALAEQEIQRNNNLNGNGSQESGSGTEGVVGLTQWFERIESVFLISNYVVENQVKFATCTLHGIALT